jgi:hypothetical protein
MLAKSYQLKVVFVEAPPISAGSLQDLVYWNLIAGGEQRTSQIYE